MDKFTQQYLETALWSSTDDAGEPLDRRYSLADVSADTLASAQADCDQFRELAGDMLDEHPELDAGAHDFWLTRNGHGAGFWDGDWPENGERLTIIAHSFGEASLYVGDDGQIYHFAG